MPAPPDPNVLPSRRWRATSPPLTQCHALPPTCCYSVEFWPEEKIEPAHHKHPPAPLKPLQSLSSCSKTEPLICTISRLTPPPTLGASSISPGQRQGKARGYGFQALGSVEVKAKQRCPTKPSANHVQTIPVTKATPRTFVKFYPWFLLQTRKGNLKTLSSQVLGAVQVNSLG